MMFEWLADRIDDFCAWWLDRRHPPDTIDDETVKRLIGPGLNKLKDVYIDQNFTRAWQEETADEK